MWLEMVNFARNKISDVNEYSETPEKKKGYPTWLKVIVSLVLMLLISIGLLWLSVQMLDVWTRHGQEAVVPSVKGAEDVLLNAGFVVEVSDSVYESRKAPGTVMEQNPKSGNRVKDGCTIYLSINAFSPRQVLLPALTDISYRQARSVLDGLGVKNVKVDTVPSDFKDLVLAVKRDGKRLMPGARVPINAHLTLEIGAGIPEEILNNEIDIDSIDIDTAYTVEKLNLF